MATEEIQEEETVEIACPQAIVQVSSYSLGNTGSLFGQGGNTSGGTGGGIFDNKEGEQNLLRSWRQYRR